MPPSKTLADDSPLQQDMRQTLQELTRAAGSLRVLTDYLERHPESLLRGKPEDKRNEKPRFALRPLAAAWLPALLAGCAQRPRPRYYSLADTVPSSASVRRPRPATVAGSSSSWRRWPCRSAWRGRRWWCGSRATRASQVEILEQHRWSSSFENELRDALASGIASRLGALDVTKGGRPRGAAGLGASRCSCGSSMRCEGERVDAAFSWTAAPHRTRRAAMVCQLALSGAGRQRHRCGGAGRPATDRGSRDRHRTQRGSGSRRPGVGMSSLSGLKHH